MKFFQRFENSKNETQQTSAQSQARGISFIQKDV